MTTAHAIAISRSTTRILWTSGKIASHVSTCMRRRSPPEKKQLAYERDHPTYAEYPHALRRTWPKKKAIAQRSFRRRVKLALATGHDRALADVRRDGMRKWSPPSLDECVRDKLHGRAYRIAYNFFKRPYVSEIHREPFTRFLEALMEERRGKARDHACAMALNLHGGSRWSRWASRREWLERFFADEPEMCDLLTSWIAALAVELSPISR
jgi:hypothetical protein